ncbi:DNA adenine methylase [Candidatus Parcubacteria bacterium]|nr:MAG: DNA adenine methylase [Candidatus Parcubacteria bacterium]
MLPLDHIATPARPMAPCQWYGGKGNIANRIVPLLPPGQVYVEPYCGMASVFWHLPQPYPVEVLNDLNGDIVNLFRCLQDPERFERFKHRITWTLYSLDEFRRALEILKTSDDPDERAWAFFVAHNQGFSGRASKEGNWSRVFVSDRSMAHNTNKWRGRIKLLQHWHDRLTRVQIDNRDALEVIRYWDSEKTVFYIDPPYILGTRVDGKAYEHECEDEHHQQLVEMLLGIEGSAVLSGYDNEIYHKLEDAGWERHEFHTVCHAAAKRRGSKLRGEGAAMQHAARTEVCWVKGGRQRRLF